MPSFLKPHHLNPYTLLLIEENLRNKVKPAPESRLSLIGRVISCKEIVSGKENKIAIRISDGENIHGLCANADDPRLSSIKKGDTILLTDAPPEKDRKKNNPRIYESCKDTRIEKIDIVFPSVEECLRKKHLRDATEGEYVIAEGFISRVDSKKGFFCKKCGRTPERVCGCSRPAEELFLIDGAFSDGTRTIKFKTDTEKDSEALSGCRREDMENLPDTHIMEQPYLILGYLAEDTFHVEEVLG